MQLLYVIIVCNYCTLLYVIIVGMLTSLSISPNLKKTKSTQNLMQTKTFDEWQGTQDLLPIKTPQGVEGMKQL